MAELYIWLFVFAAILFVFGSAAYASFRAAPWLPLRSKDHSRVLKYMKGRKGLLVDLGAGDARMLVDVVRGTDLTAHGFEISFIPFVAGLLRLQLARAGKRAKMLFKDFFMEDLSSVDVIYCFLTPSAMERLKPKFERELKKGSRVISYSFSIHGWNPTVVDRDGTGIPVWVYDR